MNSSSSVLLNWQNLHEYMMLKKKLELMQASQKSTEQVHTNLQSFNGDDEGETERMSPQ